MSRNLFIVGPVACGKNTLLDNLKKKYNINILDTGRLFRYVALNIIQNTTINPDFDKMYLGDEQEKNRIVDEIYKYNREIEKAFKELQIVEGNLMVNDKEVEEKDLYSRQVNSILSAVAKNKMVRKRILRFINYDISQRDGTYAMTGHNINEINTAQFITIFLDIDDEKAAERLYGRNPDSYTNVLEAYKEVIERNKNDNISMTRDLIPSLYNYIYLNTTNLTEEQVINKIVQEIQKIEHGNQNYSQLQQDSMIDKQDFEWLLNPFLKVVKSYLDNKLDDALEGKEYISKTDLEYQVLIKLCSYKLEQLYNGDNDILRATNQAIVTRNGEQLDGFIQKVVDQEITLNCELVDFEVKNQIIRLSELYLSNSTRMMMKDFNTSQNKGTILLDDIEFRKVEKGVSRLIARNCHYLHTPRDDEFTAYGAFIPGQALPIAWVSYSKQDREYKKQLLYYLGIEPQNTLEMTRAWCSNSAPKNIMSSLFQHSVDAIREEWKQLKEEGKVNKDLQAITTAINPNLGFKASAFLGCNFVPFAFRPAKFTYGRTNGKLEYMTRREIDDRKIPFIENQFNILPLNEMLLRLNTKKSHEVGVDKIYTMDIKKYEKVLEKGERDGNE